MREVVDRIAGASRRDVPRIAERVRERLPSDAVGRMAGAARGRPGWLFVAGVVALGLVMAAMRRRAARRTRPATVPREPQAFVGAPTDAIPAVPGGYGGVHVDDQSTH